MPFKRFKIFLCYCLILVLTASNDRELHALLFLRTYIIASPNFISYMFFILSSLILPYRFYQVILYRINNHMRRGNFHPCSKRTAPSNKRFADLHVGGENYLVS